MKFIKKYAFMLVMFGIQGYFLYDIMSKENYNLEMFFFAFAVIWFAVFFLSRNEGSPHSGVSGFRRTLDVSYIATSANEGRSAKDRVRSEKERVNILSLELMYIAMSILNVIGYIIYVVIIY